MGIWTLWNPAYWLSGGIKALTAIISIYTAIELFPLIPQLLSLPSPSQLEILNHQLQEQIKERELEEFMIILPYLTLENTQLRAEKIPQGIKQLKIQYNSQLLDSITASFGVAAFPQHGSTLQQLFNCADEALYQAKEQGRDRVICALDSQ
ncbi:MAG TPA: hypothetical protein DCF68_11480 [Cyanothece sp. UBA12306]|nr:hypothetical protein [Cyanothece sp. UBA12306]